jgi:hypothetical protein
MSKVTVLDLFNKRQGQFDAIVPIMAWCLNGHPAVSGGGSTPIPIPDEIAAATWLQLGRMVVISPTDLEPYIGIIDTPWNAILPVKMEVYDPEFLFQMRVNEAQPVKLKGSIASIISQVIDSANAKEELFLRMGNVQDIDYTYREEAFDGRPLWEQLKDMLIKVGVEMKFRAEQGEDQVWYIYLDIAKQMGTETDLLLVDGENGNMQIKKAELRGEIWNRIIGTGSQSSAASRLQTDPQEDLPSRQLYRMRDKFIQYRDVTDASLLKANTLNSLAAAKDPYLEMTVEVVNIDHSFQSLRLGNRVMVHAQNIWLPGGRHGWRGMTRITKMALVSERLVSMTLVGTL